jgi:hypothetical protein
MAYLYSTGSRGLGDIKFEGDPAETQIDFEDDYIGLKTGGNTVLVVSGSAVGIGTNEPDNTLHVKSAGTTHIKVESEAGYLAALRIKAGGQTSAYVWVPADTADLRFYVNGADRMHLDNDGKVGIGTTTPDYTLDVAGTLGVAHSISLPVGSLRTGAYTITATDFCIVADCNSSAFTVTLPSATDAMAGRIYTIKRMDSGNSGASNMLTISRNGKNIDNVAGDVLLANLEALVLQCIGADGGWIRIGQFLPPM